MLNISFNIKHKRRLLSWIGHKSLEKVLADHHFVSLEINGQCVPIDIGSKKQNNFETNWGNQLKPRELLDYLKKYREEPQLVNPDTDIRFSLHHFLFAGHKLDAPFAQISDRISNVLIKGQSTHPLLVNIPWELADGIPQTTYDTYQRNLLGTLASLPLARIIEGTQSTMKLRKKERLRVVYCISQPQGLTPINADGFHKALEFSLRDRSGMLSYKKVLGANFSPSFNQLLGEINLQAPHILIVVCHGRTNKGIPELHFEDWKPVEYLADALVEAGKTFLVLLIACDQVFLDEGPSAHSGALLMLQKGIPSVVAIQSRIRAALAGLFLEATIDQFFQNATISTAVAGGRKAMAPGKQAAKYVDWSFPALFLTENAPKQLNKLTDFIEDYIPALEKMWLSIPSEPTLFFKRERMESRIRTFLKPNERGIRAIIGSLGVGKTSLVLQGCHRAIKEAINKKNISFRPILYIDLQRHSEPIRTLEDLVDIFARRTKEVQMEDLEATLLNWPKPRSADSEGCTTDQLGLLIKVIDENRMVLVLDNITKIKEPPWTYFIEKSKRLLKSLVILISDIAPVIDITKEHILWINPLDYSETKYYVEHHLPGYNSDDVYAKTGGVLLLLNMFYEAYQKDISVLSYPSLSESQKDLAHWYANRMIDQVSQKNNNLANLLYMMVHLPNGVNGKMAGYFLADWPDLLELALANALIRDYRFGDLWLRMPGIVMQALHDIRTDEVNTARKSLTDNFIQSIDHDETADIEQNLLELAKESGGLDFLHDIYKTFVYQENWAIAAALPLLLHTWLYKNGRWFDAFKFWDCYLKNSPHENTEAHQWLKLAKTGHLLGKIDVAYDCIKKANDCNLQKIDRIEMLVLEAALLKDSGQRDKKGQIFQLYDEALRLIKEAEADTHRCEFIEYQKIRANSFYNRAIFRRWWAHDIEGALKELETASHEFESLGMSDMQMVAQSEWVDMQIDWPDLNKDWSRLLEVLFKVDQYFDSKDNHNDRCLCNYRLARLYRRKPFKSNKEQIENLKKVQQAYSIAYDLAKAAGDLRLQQIIEGHRIELSWQHLSDMSDSEAATRLLQVTEILDAFKGDSWSTRVMRDMLLLRAYSIKTQSSEIYLDTLRQTWRVASSPPLHPDHGSDARKAARIFTEYLQALEDNGELLEIDNVSILNKNLIEQWIGRSINPESREKWLDDLIKL